MGLQIRKDNICTFFPLALVSKGNPVAEVELVLVWALGTEVNVLVGALGG